MGMNGQLDLLLQPFKVINSRYFYSKDCKILVIFRVLYYNDRLPNVAGVQSCLLNGCDIVVSHRPIVASRATQCFQVPLLLFWQGSVDSLSQERKQNKVSWMGYLDCLGYPEMPLNTKSDVVGKLISRINNLIQLEATLNLCLALALI